MPVDPKSFFGSANYYSDAHAERPDPSAALSLQKQAKSLFSSGEAVNSRAFTRVRCPYDRAWKYGRAPTQSDGTLFLPPGDASPVRLTDLT